ncbi:RNA polymerase sigma-70 factor (ECF subfamily) [Pedobacter cryoconitis]|uniref:RNA polymerase sigma-70 factor (ECF subfamily) n=1 Tax=Pedobacter cryoconitis TaxID=188932 RepID=A0A7W8ZKZ3_9SPHI|nr:sigma-70 family RNA polymerase sigma factor [Pedobacter cryoconitis]MBB5635952.1 RNA polymerase sigma-70 factor (ECF subfamily) [Pedobacter cryoconitis]MBB6273132.1 RNA polymerase sigma-70 factor (ECF subfamily) [Pedobacter cryoconitis]
MAPNKKISLTEEDLVRALKDREKIAIQALYDMYSGALLGVIFRIVQHSEIAEDLLQDTFIKIWNSADNYDSSKGRLFTWMINIARNLSIDKLRSKDFRNANKNQDIENNVDFIDQQRKITFNADTMGLKDMVTALKPEFNSVLDMVYFKGYTHVEAAEELNLPLGTVKTRIRMAIMELRKHFN